MGSYCCMLRHSLSMKFRDTRNAREETKLLNKMLDFDWEHNYERIMVRLTNDFGEFLTPQASHVLICEFVRFMFLNYWNIARLKHESIPPRRYQVGNTEVNSYYGLTAPIYIDQVWLLLLHTKKYEEFWNQFFGNYVQRRDPLTKSSKSLKYWYQQTLTLLVEYEDVLTPFHNFWNAYDFDSYTDDYNSTAFLPLTDLYKLITTK